MENATNASSRSKTIVKTSLLGIAGNIMLVAAKATVGFISGSLAIVLDAVNNLTDALSSTVTLAGAKIASKRPDKKHPFGHGRTEYISSFIVAVIVLFAGLLAIYESIRGIIGDPTGKNPPDYSLVMLILIGVGVLVKVGLGLIFRRVGKKVDSEALVDSGTDALMDAVLSTSTLVAALISYFASFSLENYLGLIIGGFIVKAGISMILSSYSLLIGERASKEKTHALRSLIASYDEVKGVYDILLHNYGPSRSIGSAHIEVDDKMDAKKIHDLTREISAEVYMKLGILLTLGIYSSNVATDFAKEMKNHIVAIIKNYPSVLQLHGFYINEEERFASVDLILSWDDETPEETIGKIKGEIASIYPEYNFYIVQDLDFAD
ncbi:MAG: cation diffusion facilitator family transporter [Bacilli bacterium]|nr:cation diffusion facilitator family transporter [Bacilli bacterium]